jgi:hypothetical protein
MLSAGGSHAPIDLADIALLDAEPHPGGVWRAAEVETPGIRAKN